MAEVRCEGSPEVRVSECDPGNGPSGVTRVTPDGRRDQPFAASPALICVVEISGVRGR
jgi:hypothetical protein